jgi:hypothetical protein
MKVTIDLTEAECAAIWDDHHRKQTVAQIIEARTKQDAQAYIRRFPADAAAALTAYQEQQPPPSE